MTKPDCLTEEHILFLDDLWARGIRDFSNISLEYAFGLKEQDAKQIILYWQKLKGK